MKLIALLVPITLLLSITLLLPVAPGCGGSVTAVDLKVQLTGDALLQAASITRAVVHVDGDGAVADISEPTQIVDGMFAYHYVAHASSGTIELTVTFYDASGAVIGSGSAMSTLAAGSTVAATITISSNLGANGADGGTDGGTDACSFTFSGGSNGTAGTTCTVTAPIDSTGTKVNLSVRATTSLGPLSAFGFGYSFHVPPVAGTYSFQDATLTGDFISGGVTLNVGMGTTNSYLASSSGSAQGAGSLTITSVTGPALDGNGNMAFTVHGSMTGTLAPFPGNGAMGMVTASGTF